MEFSERLREFRTRHKMTQQEIADVLGVDRTAYTFYETGKTQPSAANIVKLSRIFNVTVGYLLGVEENSPELAQYKVITPLEEGVDPIALLNRTERKLLMYIRTQDVADREELLASFERKVNGENG